LRARFIDWRGGHGCASVSPRGEERPRNIRIWDRRWVDPPAARRRPPGKSGQSARGPRQNRRSLARISGVWEANLAQARARGEEFGDTSRPGQSACRGLMTLYEPIEIVVKRSTRPNMPWRKIHWKPDPAASTNKKIQPTGRRLAENRGTRASRAILSHRQVGSTPLTQLTATYDTASRI